MTLYTILSLVSLVFCVQILFFFLLKKSKNYLEKTFMLLVSALTLNTLFFQLLLAAGSIEAARFWYRIAYVPRVVFFIGFFLLFNAFSLKNDLPKKFALILPVILALPVIFLGLGGFWGETGLKVVNGYYHVIVDRTTLLYIYFNAYVVFTILRSAYQLIIIKRNALTNREKRMSRFLIMSLFMVWISGMFIKYFLPIIASSAGTEYAFLYGYPSVALGVFGVFYAYFKYSFLQDRIPITADIILENVDEGFLHVDTAGQITRANRAMGDMTGLTTDQLVGMNITDILPNVEWDPESMMEDALRQQTLLGELKDNPKPVVVNRREIIDRYNDLIGYLVIIRVNNKLEEATRKFALTSREIEIITLMNRGCEYNLIAELLYISPHTVRNHVQNIYTKTGTNNKTRLFRLVL